MTIKLGRITQNEKEAWVDAIEEYSALIFK